MPAKPLAQLSPAYRRRIERALAQGKTRQQARGHKAHEHVERKQREIEEHGISSGQAATIRAWCARYPNSAREADDVIEVAADRGYEWFQNYRQVWNQARGNYSRSMDRGTYFDAGEDYLDQLMELADVPDEKWMFYH